MPEYPVEKEKKPVVAGAPEPTGIPAPSPPAGAPEPRLPPTTIVGAPEPTGIPTPPPPAVVVGAPEPFGIPTPPPPVKPPKPPKPPPKPTFETIPVTTFTDIPRTKLVTVETSYARLHPEAVIKIGDRYYRPAVPAGWRKKGEPLAETYVRRFEHLRAVQTFEATKTYYEELYKELHRRADKYAEQRIALQLQKELPLPAARRRTKALLDYETATRSEAKEIKKWLGELKHRVKSLKGIERIHALSVLRPYVSREGIDVERAIRDGISLAEIRHIGVTEKVIRQALMAIKTWDKTHTKLPDGGWISNIELRDEKEKAPDLYEILITKGFKEYVKAHKEKYKIPVEMGEVARTVSRARYNEFMAASGVLTRAGLRDGINYEVVDALIHDDPKVVEAIKVVFADNPEVIREAEKFIKENYYPQWEEKDLKGFPLAVSKLWRKLTPWEEKKGGTFSSYAADIIKKEVPETQRLMFFGGKAVPYEDKREVKSIIGFPVGKVEGAFSDAAKWLDTKYMPWVEDYTLWWNKELAKPQVQKEITQGSWKHLGSETIVTEEPMPRPVQAITKGIIDLTTTIPAMILGVGASSVLHSSAGEKQQAVLAPAMLIAGMTDWIAGRPIAFKKDPYFEVPYTLVLFRGGPVKTALKVAKKLKWAINPMEISNTTLALQADIGRVGLTPKMTEFTARSHIQAVEWAWGGKKAVPSGIKKLPPFVQVVLTATLRNTKDSLVKRDVVYKDKGGKVIGHVSPFQKTTSNTAFHATGDITPFMKDLGKKGYFWGEAPGWGGFWLSQQLPQAFLTRGGIVKPGSLMIRYTIKDLKETPLDVLSLPKMSMMRDAMQTLALRGKLKPGIYPVYKHMVRHKTYELELFAVGMKFNAVKPRWYAKKYGGTASTATHSLISFQDALGNKITEGGKVPILIVATNSAMKAKLGVPKLSDIYKAEIVWNPLIAMRKWAPWNIAVRQPVRRGEYDIPTVSGELWSNYQALKLISPRKAFAEVAAEKFFKKRKGEEGFTIKDALLLGETMDKRGYITKTREAYLHESPARAVRGQMVNSRVTVIIRHPRTNEILVVQEVAGLKGAYSLPGGRIDPVGKIRLRKYRDKITLEEALREQILDELGIELKDVRRVGLYQGHTTEHAMKGTYVFSAVAMKSKLKLKVKEVSDYKWIKSGSKVKVPISTKDMLKGVGWFDATKLKTYKLSKWMRKRDKKFGDRVLKWMEQKEALDSIYRIAKKEPKEVFDKVGEEWLMKQKELQDLEADPLLLQAYQEYISREWVKQAPALRKKGIELTLRNIKKGIAPEVTNQQVARMMENAARKIVKDWFKRLKEEYPSYIKRLEEMERLEDRYGYLPYKPVRGKRGVLGIYKEPEPKEKAMIMPYYTEYKPTGVEYALLYPEIEERYLPKYLVTEPVTEPVPEPVPYPVPEPVTEPVPEPEPEPVPEPEPEPVPEPVLKYPPPPSLDKRLIMPKEKRVARLGKIAWRQGSLKIRGELRGQWYVVNPPYKSATDMHRQFTKPIGAHLLKGVGSAYRTIQQLGGNPNILLGMDMGIMDIKVRTPKRRGEKGAIRFKRDIGQKTKHPISLKSVRTI